MSPKDDTKLWYVILLCCAVLCFPFGYICGQSRTTPEPPLPSLINIQERVGAEPDGIYGAETKTLWEAAYANQEAAKFMTADGSPK